MSFKSNNIRVGLVGPSWPFRGGIAKYTTQLAHELSQRGYLVSFVSPEKQYPKILFPGKSDKDFQSCKPLPLTKALYSYFEPWTWRKVIKEMKVSNVECIVAPHWSTTSAPFLKYLIHNSPKPVIPIVHNFSDHDLFACSSRWMEWVLKGGAGYLHHNPEFSDLRFFKSRADRVRCHLLPVNQSNKIEPSVAKDLLGVPKGKTVFLFYGLIRKYKGLNVFLEALKSLPGSLPIAVLIAGEPWQRKKQLEVCLEELSQKFWIKSKLDWISEKETARWFSAADGVVLPYLKATGSAVASQAFSYEKPILTTRTGSMNQLIKDGVNGLLSHPGSAHELATNIETFLEPGVSERLSLGVRNSPTETWESYVDSLLSLAEKVVEKPF